MAIAPIPSVPGIPNLPSLSPATKTGAAAGSDTFSNLVTHAVDALQQAQGTASQAEAQAASGQGNLADTMIAASKASLDTQVSTDIVNKAITSYNAIMTMQV